MIDIFKKEPHGGVLWMGTAKDEEEVREIYKKFLAANPGVYFTVDPSTREKRTITPEEFDKDGQTVTRSSILNSRSGFGTAGI